MVLWIITEADYCRSTWSS